MFHINKHSSTRRINSPAKWRHPVIACIFAVAFPAAVACDAQTFPSDPIPSTTQPASHVAAIMALNKLPRYAGAAVPIADRDPATHHTLETLQRIVPQFACENLPLKKLLDRLQEETALNLSVQWIALNKASIKRETPVTLALKNVTYHEILALALASISLPQDRLAYQVQEGSVVVSTEAIFASRRQFVGYDLDTYVTVYFNRNIPAKQQEEEADTLLDLIQKNIEPAHWKKAENTISRLHGTLVANAPPAVHDQIAQLLADIQTPARPPKAPPLLAQSTTRAPAYRALQKPIPDLPIAAPLADALQQINKTAGVNMFIDWPTLIAAGITPDTQTSITPQNWPAGQAFQMALKNAGPDPKLLDFVMDDEGVVIVSTVDRLASQTAVGVYDLRDWIKRQQYRAHNNTITADDLLNPLMDKLKEVIAPESWGKTASIQQFQGLLIVKATAKNQRLVLELLTKLMKQ
jgi:hypothetical protein